MSSDRSVTLSDADMKFMAAIFKNGGNIELTNVNWEAVIADTGLKNIATAKSTWQRVKKKVTPQAITGAQTSDKAVNPQKRKAEQADFPKKAVRNKRKVKVEPELPDSEPDLFTSKANSSTGMPNNTVANNDDFFDDASNKE